MSCVHFDFYPNHNNAWENHICLTESFVGSKDISCLQIQMELLDSTVCEFRKSLKPSRNTFVSQNFAQHL